MAIEKEEPVTSIGFIGAGNGRRITLFPEDPRSNDMMLTVGDMKINGLCPEELRTIVALCKRALGGDNYGR